MAYADTNFRAEILRYLNARLKLENEKIKQLTRLADAFEVRNGVNPYYVEPKEECCCCCDTRNEKPKDLLDRVNDIIKEVDSQN